MEWMKGWKEGRKGMEMETVEEGMETEWKNRTGHRVLFYFSYLDLLPLNGSTDYPACVKLAGLDDDSKAFMVTTALYGLFFPLHRISWVRWTRVVPTVKAALIVSAVGTFIRSFCKPKEIHSPSALVFLWIISCRLCKQHLILTLALLFNRKVQAAKRISIVGICNKNTGTISPIVLSICIERN